MKVAPPRVMIGEQVQGENKNKKSKGNINKASVNITE